MGCAGTATSPKQAVQLMPCHMSPDAWMFTSTQKLSYAQPSLDQVQTSHTCKPALLAWHIAAQEPCQHCRRRLLTSMLRPRARMSSSSEALGYSFFTHSVTHLLYASLQAKHNQVLIAQWHDDTYPGCSKPPVATASQGMVGCLVLTNFQLFAAISTPNYQTRSLLGCLALAECWMLTCRAPSRHSHL